MSNTPGTPIEDVGETTSQASQNAKSQVPQELLNRAAERKAELAARKAARIGQVEHPGTSANHPPAGPTTVAGGSKAAKAGSGAKILAAGASVAVGVGLVGAMGVVAANAGGQPAPVVERQTRVVVVSQPVSPTPELLPAPAPQAPSAAVAGALGQPQPAVPAQPTVQQASLEAVAQAVAETIQESEPSPAPRPEPVTVSEGS